MLNKKYNFQEIKNKKSQNNFFYCVADQGKGVKILFYITFQKTKIAELEKIIANF